jgi:hypothetical protein
LVFNSTGYQLLTSWLENKANRQLEMQLDNSNYNETELFSIKVPITQLSYYTNSNLFERIDGKMEIGDAQYHYVKRRLYNDSLELICILNRPVMKLQDARNDFMKLVNDLQSSGQGKKGGNHPGSMKDFSVDYYNDHHLFYLDDPDITLSQKTFYISSLTSFDFSSVIEDPPECC